MRLTEWNSEKNNPSHQSELTHTDISMPEQASRLLFCLTTFKYIRHESLHDTLEKRTSQKEKRWLSDLSCSGFVWNCLTRADAWLKMHNHWVSTTIYHKAARGGYIHGKTVKVHIIHTVHYSLYNGWTCWPKVTLNRDINVCHVHCYICISVDSTLIIH